MIRSRSAPVHKPRIHRSRARAHANLSIVRLRTRHHGRKAAPTESTAAAQTSPTPRASSRCPRRSASPRSATIEKQASWSNHSVLWFLDAQAARTGNRRRRTPNADDPPRRKKCPNPQRVPASVYAFLVGLNHGGGCYGSQISDQARCGLGLLGLRRARAGAEHQCRELRVRGQHRAAPGLRRHDPDRLEPA